MDWNIRLRDAIYRCVKDEQLAKIFSQALYYKYVFDLLREDESLPMPEYSEFEYTENDH